VGNEKWRATIVTSLKSHTIDQHFVKLISDCKQALTGATVINGSAAIDSISEPAKSTEFSTSVVAVAATVSDSASANDDDLGEVIFAPTLCKHDKQPPKKQRIF
jgi:hypothetical protein